MYIGYAIDKQIWKDLLQALKNTEGITLSYFPQTDKEGFFTNYKFVTFEYGNQFFYVQEWFCEGVKIVPYIKHNPYEKQQIGYAHPVTDLNDILEFIKAPRVLHPFQGTHKQRIYLTELYGLSDGTTTLYKLANKWAGHREKNILSNLDRIEMTMHTKDYEVLRFHHKDGTCFFDFETKSKSITN